MQSIEIILKAKNSSGEQELSLTKDGDEFWFTLVGKYRGESIQIDFDSMTRMEMLDLKTMVDLMVEG